MDQLKALLQSPEDRRLLTVLGHLGVDISESYKATKSTISDKEKAASKIRQKNAPYDLMRYAPKLEKILNDYMSESLNPTEFGSMLIPEGSKQTRIIKTDLRALRSKNISKGKKNDQSKLVLFIIGGISYPEIRVFKQLGKPNPKISQFFEHFNI